MNLLKWFKNLFIKPTPKPIKKRQITKRTLLDEHKQKYPLKTNTRLPRSFTNNPRVKQSQVNLKKVGYKKGDEKE